MAEIEFRFEPKSPPEVIETVDELDRHSGGRRERRDGTVESISVGQAAVAAPPKALTKPEDKTFPSGSIRFGHDDLLAIGRAHGGGWDIDMIASGFREHMGERLEKLRGVKLAAAWKGFCESWVTRRGRAL